MIISQRNLDKTLEKILRSRSRTPIAYYVLGGVGLSIVGGLVALMILDPAARTRAVGGAKYVYERLNAVASNDVTADPPLTNGLAAAKLDAQSRPATGA